MQLATTAKRESPVRYSHRQKDRTPIHHDFSNYTLRHRLASLSVAMSGLFLTYKVLFLKYIELFLKYLNLFVKKHIGSRI